MSLLSILNESSNLPIEDLKKAIQKDKRIKQLFSKDLSLNSIQDKKEFLSTAKFFLFNNREVIDFVKSRKNIRDLSDFEFNYLRKLRAEDLTERDVQEIKSFAQLLFREFNHVEKVGISASTRKELSEWINSNRGYHSLTLAAQRELSSIPGLRPPKPVTLYRGLLFRESSMKEERSWNGELSVGNGLRFLRSIRKGTRIVDLTWDRPSSWTTSKSIAENFAKYGPASSSFAATMQWLQRSADGNAIDGLMGFIISFRAQPDDILVDLRRISGTLNSAHGEEGEFILKPGTYTCRINTKFTKQGEVDPVETSVDLDAERAVIDELPKFNESWKLPAIGKIKPAETSIHMLFNVISINEAKALASGSKIESAFLELQHFYNEKVKELDPKNLRDLVLDTHTAAAAQWLLNLQHDFTLSVSTGPKKTDFVRRGDARFEQYRRVVYSVSRYELEPIKYGVRFTDSSSGRALFRMANFLGIDGEFKNVYKTKLETQTALLDKFLDSFYDKFGVNRPESNVEAFELMKRTFIQIEQNFSILSDLGKVKESLIEAINHG
jgi:hypothetical protein